MPRTSPNLLPPSHQSHKRTSAALMEGRVPMAGLSSLPSLACDLGPEGARWSWPGVLGVQRWRGDEAILGSPPALSGLGCRGAAT